MKELILKYAHYNQWANAKLIKLLIGEQSQLLDREVGSSFNTIRKTVLHLADAEYIWITRLTSTIPNAIPSEKDRGLEVLSEMDEDLIMFIDSKDESFFAQFTSYKNLKGESCNNNHFSILWHVFNHSTFHRGQIVTMLRSQGFSGVIDSTDFITFERLPKSDRMEI